MGWSSAEYDCIRLSPCLDLPDDAATHIIPQEKPPRPQDLHSDMDLIKGAVGEEQVNKAIDQAAGVAKEKVGQLIGTGGKQQQKQQQKQPAPPPEPPKTEPTGLCDILTNAAEKAISDAAKDKAADSAIAFGKKLLG